MEYIKDMRKLIGKKPLIVGAAGVIILDKNNKVLLQKRMDDDNWCIPGGIMDIGESAEETAKREVFEETNLRINEMKIFNVYSGSHQHHIYPNGDEVYFVNIVYISTNYYGIIQIDEKESKEVKFFSLTDLPGKISPTNKPFFEDLLKQTSSNG